MRRVIIVLCLLFLCGCQSNSSPVKPVAILESEYFPVKVEVNGVAFDKMSILDLIAMSDWGQVKITPVRKGEGEGSFTHYLVTQRAIDKLRPKAE